MRLSLYTLFIAALGTVSTAYAAASKTELPRQASAEGSRVYIISPADGEIVGRKFTVKFGLQGMGVAPAGVDKPNTGHHHLLIDMNTLPFWWRTNRNSFRARARRAPLAVNFRGQVSYPP